MRIFTRKQTQTPPDWTFFSNHAHVLICLYREPEIRLRDVAEAVGITERGVQRIVAELEQEGYLTRERVGRRNRYTVHVSKKLRHPVEQPATLRDLMQITRQT